MVGVSREAIEAVVRQWERMAKGEMYLDDYLHPKARAWLIEAIEILHAQSAPESSEVESSRVESKPITADDIADMRKTMSTATDEMIGVSRTRKKGT